MHPVCPQGYCLASCLIISLNSAHSNSRLELAAIFPLALKLREYKIVQKTQASTIGPSLIGPLGNSLRKTSQGKFTCAVTWNFHSLEGHDFNLKFFPVLVISPIDIFPSAILTELKNNFSTFPDGL